jgi:hypothetical protein
VRDISGDFVASRLIFNNRFLAVCGTHLVRQMFVAVGDAGFGLLPPAECFLSLRSPTLPPSEVLLKQRSSPAVVMIG